MVHLCTMWLSSFVVISAITLYGCSFSSNYGDAKNASNTFHRLMDSGEHAAIYHSATDGFQKSSTRDQLIGLLTRVNRKMGKCGEASAAFGGYQVTTSGTFVSTTSYRTFINGKL